jgi:hypothetical protein
MPNLVISRLVTTGLATLAVVSLSALPMSAQTVKPSAKSAIRRMPDGHPDLQGTYDLATMTPLERLPGLPAVLSKEQAEKLQKAEAVRRTADGGLLPKAGDKQGATSYFGLLEELGGGNVGGYNRLWLNQGTTYTVLDGQIRTSLVIDPSDGKVPPLNAAAKARHADSEALPTSDAAEETQDAQAAVAGSQYDNPEQRPLSERCILGFGSTSGPPILPDYFYNDMHQIVQTSDNIMILTEMIHDARVVRMNVEHLPKGIRRWMGDSVGRWEGDTLVIDTTNFTDKTRFRGSTENLHVIERLRRLDDKTLLYRFTVEDPQTWDRPWTGEMTWPATDKPILEYACHEGNYALGDVMRGARHQEGEEAKAK